MSIKISDPTLQQLFGTIIRYTIPPYQRRYRWQQEAQWEPLWDDIRELAEQWLVDSAPLKDDPHFLGALVLRPLQNVAIEPQNREVIDGQQRLTTLQILLDAVQAVFKELADSHAGPLESLILNNEDYTKHDQDHRFKVWPSKYDQDAFRAVMDDHASSEEYGDSLITQAHDFFFDAVDSWIKAAASSDEQARLCEALFAVLTQHLQFVVIDVTGERIANTIFETLNARGTPLQAWDLVKNFMYERAGDAPDFEDWFEDHQLKFDEEWWQSETGSGRNRHSNADLYLNHFVVLRTHKEASSRTSNAVYRDFVAYAESVDSLEEKTIRAVGTDFSRIGEVYREIMDPSPDERHRRFLSNWRIQGHTVLTPVLLWLWSSDVPTEELNLAVRALDSYFGRRLICQGSSKDYRELSIGLLKELNDAGPRRAGNVTRGYVMERSNGVETLKWPTDEEVREVLVNRRLYGQLTVTRVQMVLEAIERQLRDDSGVAEQLTESFRTIEHVMPQKWPTHWARPRKGGTDETPMQRRERLVHSIGNLTLVTSRLNSKMRNGPWREKKKMLSNHGMMYLNSGLIEHDSQWNDDAITNRSHLLADVVTRVWPAPEKL